jgi:endoglucanase
VKCACGADEPRPSSRAKVIFSLADGGVRGTGSTVRNPIAFGLTLAATAGLYSACSGTPPRTGCEEGTLYVKGQCLIAAPVSLNSVGFLPKRQKRATFGGDDPAFSVVDAETGTQVLSGTAVGPRANQDTLEQVFVADFSQLETPGNYYIETATGRSVVFSVGAAVLDAVLEATMLGLYGQRCGEHVQFSYGEERYAHRACHLQPASFERIGEGLRDDTGGWHDAGDYGKYTLPGAFAVGILLQAYEHFPDVLSEREFEMPERGGDTPDILDEARVELEWLLKVQFDDGSFAHKVTAANFEAEMMPEGDRQPRFFISTSTPSTGAATAALALASRLFEPFDATFAATCLEAAERGQAFLAAHPDLVSADQSGVVTGSYGDSSDVDERLWVLAELWQTTGDSEYLAAVEQLIPEVPVRGTFGWPDSANLGFSTYAFSERPGRDQDTLDGLRWDLQAAGRELTTAAAAHGYGRGFESYYWGSNGTVALMSHTLAAQHRVAGDTAALDALTAQIDFLLGRNFDGRSYVTGVGVDGPMHPHHRPSTNDAAFHPWPGLLVGGPGPEGNDSAIGPVATTYGDTQANYYDNEVTVYWNAALVYALAAAVSTQDDTSADCQPDCLTPSSDGMGGMGGAGGAGGAGGSGG